MELSRNRRDRHLLGAGPKRILSLDGGGVRGVISIAFLERLEKEISEIEGRPTLLGEWFDLIGGTSTGAISNGACAGIPRGQPEWLLPSARSADLQAIAIPRFRLARQI